MQKHKTVLPNDYERMIPEYHKGTGVYGEHIARYSAIGSITKNKVVLDIASGSGYGTAIIAHNAKQVTGVDVSEEAVAYSRENYAAPNITYKVGDGEKIPADDRSFDVVTSFETIEHIKDYKKFMDECVRVLKDDGIFLLSTPNDEEFAEGNHFHLHEFKHDELMKLAKKYFTYVKPYYQATWIGNMVGDEKMLSSEWEESTHFIHTAPIDRKKYLYFYFLCSNRPITEHVENIGVISEHWSERKKVEQESKQRLTDQHIVNLEEIVTSLKAENEALKKSLPHKISTRLSTLKNVIKPKK